MFFPYRDDNPRILTPYVTYALVGLNVVVFLYQFTLSGVADLAFTISFGLIPAIATGIPGDQIVMALADNLKHPEAFKLYDLARPHSPVITIFTSMFIHGGFVHLIGNMWFLWLFGDNVESFLGHFRFAVFFVLCGVAAGLTQVFIDIHSIIPMVGASGAISGVLAGYVVRYPRARVHVLIFLFIFITTIDIPAFIVIGIWFLEQLTNGLGSLGVNTTGGVAWFAHIGGFVAGLIFINLSRKIRIIRG